MDERPADSKVTTLGVVAELLVLGAGLLLGTGIVALLFSTHAFPSPRTHPWTLVVAGPVVMFAAATVYTLLDRRGIPALTHAFPPDRARPIREPASVGRAALEVLVHIAIALAGAVAIGLCLDALGFPVEEQPQIEAIVHGGWSLDLALLGVAALVLAPVSEEWLFRHMLFRRLHHVAGAATAFVLSAVLFSLAHFNPSGFLTYAWLAVAFASVYRRTGRPFAPIVVHAVNNAVTLWLLVQVE